LTKVGWFVNVSRQQAGFSLISLFFSWFSDIIPYFCWQLVRIDWLCWIQTLFLFFRFVFLTLSIAFFYLKRDNLWTNQLAHFLWETVQSKDIMLYLMSMIWVKCPTNLSLILVSTKVLSLLVFLSTNLTKDLQHEFPNNI
jgi:hypothetical protein